MATSERGGGAWRRWRWRVTSAGRRRGGAGPGRARPPPGALAYNADRHVSDDLAVPPGASPLAREAAKPTSASAGAARGWTAHRTISRYIRDTRLRRPVPSRSDLCAPEEIGASDAI